jgi:hypothetical protein
MFNIELRNRRTEVIDRAKDEHAKAIARVAGRGITTMFVVPRCTRRFRREVEELGGVVVETGVYVTTTEKQRDALASFSWMTLPVELGTNSAPGVVGRIAPVILTPEDRMIRAPHDGATEASDPMNEGDKAEIDRYIALAIQQRQQTAKVRRSAQRVKRAMELYESGVPTVEQAASRIGKIGERQLRRAFEDVGEPLPWGHGGPRQGAGRKSSGHHDRDMPTP